MSDERLQREAGAGNVAAAIATLAVERFVKFTGIPAQGLPDDSRVTVGTADAGGEEHGTPDRQYHPKRIGDVDRDRRVNPRRRHHHDRAEHNADQCHAK